MILLLCILLTIPLGHHALYLSTCEILIEEDWTWQGSIRIFHDDLEDALQNATGSRPNLTLDLIHLEQTDIELYLNEHLFFKTESGRLPYEIVQIVRTEDVVEIRLKGIQSWKSTHIIVHNDLLIELFESQKNIMTIRKSDQLSTHYFNKRTTVKELN
ncbi:MAG: hypothetical protein IPL46_21500 [Saprospiraceae bacterium]|nr:hypothetical protein [Saprospiraceae bacterium]